LISFSILEPIIVNGNIVTRIGDVKRGWESLDNNDFVIFAI